MTPSREERARRAARKLVFEAPPIGDQSAETIAAFEAKIVEALLESEAAAVKEAAQVAREVRASNLAAREQTSDPDERRRLFEKAFTAFTIAETIERALGKESHDT